MPIFEFRCLECGEVFEELVLGSNAEVFCKKCHSCSLEKLISAVSFKSGGAFTPASGSSGCTGCSGKTCSSCK